MALTKKYNQFPAGVFTPSKLILQADPNTGALEKITLGTVFPINAVIGKMVTSLSAVTSLTIILNTYTVTFTAVRTTVGEYLLQASTNGIFNGNTVLIFTTNTPGTGYYTAAIVSGQSIIYRSFDSSDNAIDKFNTINFALLNL